MQFLPQEQPPSAARKGLRLKPDVSQIGCDKQACDAGAAHVEGEATSHSGSAQELRLGCHTNATHPTTAHETINSRKIEIAGRIKRFKAAYDLGKLTVFYTDRSRRTFWSVRR